MIIIFIDQEKASYSIYQEGCDRLEQQITVSLSNQLKTSITRGLKWYKKSLKMMNKIISNVTDARLIKNEIRSIEQFINQLNQQTTFRSFPKQTILNQSSEQTLIKQTLSDLQSNPESVVLGWVNDDHWLEVQYVPDKGYELRIQDELVRETPDLDVITEVFVSWGKRKNLLNV